MKLIDLLLVIDDFCNVIVWKGDNVFRSIEREGIPEELNNDEVTEVTHSTEAIVIYVR